MNNTMPEETEKKIEEVETKEEVKEVKEAD